MILVCQYYHNGTMLSYCSSYIHKKVIYIQLKNTITLNLEPYALKTMIRNVIFKKMHLNFAVLMSSCNNRESPLGNNRKT